MSSERTKEELRAALIERYGENFKTPLARELGVNVSTIRRIFNEDKPIPELYAVAINCLLFHEDQSR